MVAFSPSLSRSLAYEWLLLTSMPMSFQVNTRSITKSFVEVEPQFEQMPTLYRTMLEHAQPQIKECLGIIAEHKNAGAVLIHCEHGRDRTGVIAALVLACIGTDDEHIFHDYHLSEPFTRSSVYFPSRITYRICSLTQADA